MMSALIFLPMAMVLEDAAILVTQAEALSLGNGMIGTTVLGGITTAQSRKST
jgi:hypothetical protein